MNTIMKVGDLACTLHSPAALRGSGTHRLPPCSPVIAYPVDEYPTAPANWIRGSGKQSSYFLPVKPGRGLWLDFNECWNSKYDVAILISIQGVNPITGQPMDATGLEQYVTKCPVHSVEFQAERFCPECKFKWPKQNYLCTTGQPSSMLWLDGFRDGDGKVRQYLITEEEARGVAAQVIGRDRVFAIGVSFYLSKNPKPTPPPSPLRGLVSTSNLDFMSFAPPVSNWMVDYSTYSSDVKHTSGLKASTSGLKANSVQCCASHGTGDVMGAVSMNAVSERKVAYEPSAPVKNLEIGAGALIDQVIHDDPNTLDYWRDQPEGFIYLNYVGVEQLTHILGGGKREEKASFLAGLKVGN